MSNNILVAIDYGRESDCALDQAIELAARLNAGLEIAHVVPPPPPPLPPEADTPEVQAGSERLAQAAEKARQKGLIAVTHLRMDTVVFSLLELIEERKPLLVVVGSHGRHGVSRALLGSVSDSLARRAGVPVVIVPAPARQAQADKAAWCCAACGHILGEVESPFVCAHCGATGGDWISAPMVAGPADVGEPATGEAVGEPLVETQTRSSLGLFSTSAPGQEGVDVNPELRVRY